jgi:hypothetical protein
MQFSDTYLGLDPPVVSKVHRLSCIIIGYTSQCNPDDCYQAGGRCVPNEKNTICLPKLHTSVYKRAISWASRPETRQASQYCSCVRHTPGVTLPSKHARQKLTKRNGTSTKIEEARPAEVKASAAEKHTPELECDMIAKRGAHCNEVDCQNEGGRCSPKQNTISGAYFCYSHMLRNGVLYPVQFESVSRLLPSCTACRCSRKDPPKKMPDLECVMVNRPGHFCQEAECKREGGRCLSRLYRSEPRCYGHAWVGGLLYGHQFKGSHLLPSCSGCRCSSKDDPPKYVTEKLAGKRKFEEEFLLASEQLSSSSEGVSSSSRELSPSSNSRELSTSSEEGHTLSSAELSLSSVELESTVTSRKKKGI